jgi:hypothetical protein
VNALGKGVVRVSACLVTMLVLAPDIAAQQGGALSRTVADGKPWNMTMVPENRRGVLTLHPDGTGALAGGPMPMSPTWRATAEGLCLKPSRFMPERCVSLKREGPVIVGLNDGSVLIRLER